MHLARPTFDGSGGSSITQQLVKNIYIASEDRSERSYARKVKETVYALELTNNYSKNQILEWYLNQISYGGLYNGVEAASQGYFGKHAKDLNLAEAATIAGIPACPSCYDPVTNPEGATARRNEILNIMHRREQTTVPGPDGKDIPATRLQVNEDGTDIKLDGRRVLRHDAGADEHRAAALPGAGAALGVQRRRARAIARYGKEALYSGGPARDDVA